MSSAFSFNFVCTFFATGRSSFLMAKLHRHLYKLCPCQNCLQLILIMVLVPIPQPMALKNCDVSWFCIFSPHKKWSTNINREVVLSQKL
jgi:hypothetical protein